MSMTNTRFDVDPLDPPPVPGATWIAHRLVELELSSWQR